MFPKLCNKEESLEKMQLGYFRRLKRELIGISLDNHTSVTSTVTLGVCEHYRLFSVYLRVTSFFVLQCLPTQDVTMMCSSVL